MYQIIKYLELKNMYYEKFLSISQKFLNKARANYWDDLTVFIDNRERILNIIRAFDYKIAQFFEEIDLTNCELNSYRFQVRALLMRRKELIDKIVEVDLELISKIEELKNETIKELKFQMEKQQQLELFSEHTKTKPVITKSI